MKHIKTFNQLNESVLNEGTSAIIAVKNEDGKYVTTKVQYDGYVEGVGEELFNEFGEQKDAEQMAIHGEMRGIQDGKPDYYDDGFDSVTVDTIEDAKSEFSGGSYIYVYDPDLVNEEPPGSGWVVQYIGQGWQGEKGFIDLSQAIHRPKDLPGY